MAETSTTSVAARMWHPVARYGDMVRLWVRAELSYPASFAMLVVGSMLINALDFAGIAIMFSSIDSLGGFGLREIALLYGATGVGIGIADTLIGSVERIGEFIRTGRLDQMLTKPVPLLVQVCSDRFTLRRLGRITQASVVMAWALPIVDWTLSRVIVAVLMVISSSALFFGLFVLFSCVQFWTSDASEFANAFTYGGNTLTQYPLTVFPRELAIALTVVLPIAFVNWYPCLYLLGRPDPFDFPEWLQFCSPLAAALVVAAALLVWRTGVRRYTSTGS